MKKIILVALVFFSISISVGAQESFYISPGLSLGWDGGSSLIFGWKVSLGYYMEEKCYYNITFGKQNTIFTDVKNEQINYGYLEIQRGDFFGYYPFSAGGGIGITFLNDKIYPKISLSAGALLFINLNYTFNKNLFDLGGNLVLPIPFKKEYRDLNPG